MFSDLFTLALLNQISCVSPVEPKVNVWLINKAEIAFPIAALTAAPWPKGGGPEKGAKRGGAKKGRKGGCWGPGRTSWTSWHLRTVRLGYALMNRDFGALSSLVCAPFGCDCGWQARQLLVAAGRGGGPKDAKQSSHSQLLPWLPPRGQKGGAQRNGPEGRGAEHLGSAGICGLCVRDVHL